MQLDFIQLTLTLPQKRRHYVKLTTDQVLFIRQAKGKIKQEVLASKLGVAQSTISRIQRMKLRNNLL